MKAQSPNAVNGKAMDLEGECSSPRHVEDKEENPETIPHFNEIQVENNGSCGNEVGDFSSGDLVELKASAESNGKDFGVDQPVETPLKSPSGGSSPTAKGYGLKKWRRIRRDFTKNGDNDIDFNRILKRGLSNTMEPVKPRNLSVENKQKNEGSVVSANSSVKSPGVSIGIARKGSSSDSRFVVRPVFPVATDSKSSEDRSSNSSTAASTPNLRYAMPVVSVSAQDRNKVKNPTGKNSGHAVQRAQQEKGRIETSEKVRGEGVKIEKENSFSSMESDSRSSNIIFTQGSFSMLNNGRQSERSTNYDRKYSDQARASKLQSSNEIQTGYIKEKGGEVEDYSQDDVDANRSWEFKEEEGESSRPSTDQDPLTESIVSLQAVQKALEKGGLYDFLTVWLKIVSSWNVRLEVQKFGEIGKEPILLPDNSIQGLSLPAGFNSIDPEINELSSQLYFEEIGQSDSLSLHDQLINFKQKVNILDNRLEELSTMIKAKESRAVELEAILNSGALPKEESESTLESLQKCREIEIELEDLFKQKIEAEVEYLAMTRTTQKLKVDQLTLFEGQKCLAWAQMQMVHKLRDAESKAVVLKRWAEELEASCAAFLGTGEVLKMQNRKTKDSYTIPASSYSSVTSVRATPFRQQHSIVPFLSICSRGGETIPISPAISPASSLFPSLSSPSHHLLPASSSPPRSRLDPFRSSSPANQSGIASAPQLRSSLSPAKSVGLVISQLQRPFSSD
ncbi:hypothetical protein HHK36_005903 [Tetracentron sinense]|uniref:Uncharacterized protein n=1 Tax=Tetracentron sinense TaxID=13715 RepID=A0A834ZLV6_TETSI|nr:hypothetical protein HHK36_005903 [Tetracentron sinense]